MRTRTRMGLMPVVALLMGLMALLTVVCACEDDVRDLDHLRDAGGAAGSSSSAPDGGDSDGG